jgi:hypothetical protein
MHVDLAHTVDLRDIPQGKDGVRHGDIMRAAYRREGQPFPEKAALPAGSYLCLGLAELLAPRARMSSGALQRAVMGSMIDRLPTRRNSYGVGLSLEREPMSPAAHRHKKA